MVQDRDYLRAHVSMALNLQVSPTSKRRLENPKWEDNAKIYIKEIGIDKRNWVDSAQDRDYWRALVNAALNLRVS